MLKPGLFAALVLLGGLFGPASGPVRAASLPSYDASYTLRLVEASSARGPRAATGRLNFKFVETCDGWKTVQSIKLELAFRDGTTMTNERDFSSWEAKNGRSYEFAVRTVKGGVPVEAFRGKAKMRRRSGEVSYELPKSDTGKGLRRFSVRLPGDTLLPVAYLSELIDRAERGEQIFKSTVFSGSSASGPRTLSAAIGPRLESHDEIASLQDHEIDPNLLDVPAWDLSLAYYNLIERRDTPNFEVFQRSHANGISLTFEQSFEDFKIAAELDRLTALPAQSCG
ncbi:MAG: DUF1849 family protein [Rhodobacteraceae bacterium]|nr:DUF1849 family protein [Paracoccaceae bacterium]